MQYKLSEIMDIIGGGTPKTSKAEYWNGNIPWITVKDFNGSRRYVYSTEKCITEQGLKNSSTKLLKKDDIIISARGIVGEIAIIPYPMAFNQSCYGLRANNFVTPLFLYYLLMQNINILKRNTHGTVFDTITKDTFDNIIVDLPPKENQQKIASILSILDDKIELNNAINDNLQQQLKLIYDYWFTQFDFPDENGKPYRSSGGAMVWNEQLKKKIPKDWKVYNLGELCDILLGGTPDTSNDSYWNGTINWLNSGEVSQFPIVSSELRITQLGLDNSATKLMPANTVVVSITGNIRASILAIDSCANQSVVGILESEELKYQYIYPYMCNLLTHYTSVSTGNCQQHINKGTIEDSYILIPDKATLQTYYHKTEFLYKQIINNAIEIQKLTNLRDWLLPMLMNGQATISD